MALILPDLCNRSQKCEFLIQNPSESYMLATDLETSKDTLGAKQTCLCAYMACPLPAASRKPGLRDSCSLCPLDSPSFLGKAHATPCMRLTHFVGKCVYREGRVPDGSRVCKAQGSVLGVLPIAPPATATPTPAPVGAG